jgi:hypothetical protein
MTHRQHTFAAVQVTEDSMTMGTVLTKKIILQEASKTVQSPITMQELTKAMQKGRDENRQGGWNTARFYIALSGIITDDKLTLYNATLREKRLSPALALGVIVNSETRSTPQGAGLSTHHFA